MEQEVVDGIINRYTEYDYDHAGNVVGSQTHYLQPNGEFALSFIKVLLYFPTGNLYKQLTYVPSTKTEEEPILITTETFDSYVNKTNPFPVVDVLPNVKAQKWLPTSYKYENEEQAIQYYFSYEYNAEGKVIKRTTTGPGTNEVAAYSYY